MARGDRRRHRRRRRFAFVISPAALSSPVCARELDRATAQGKRIVPILRSEPDGAGVPESLASRNWILARDDRELDPAVDSLVGALETDLDRVRQHTRLLVRAVEWDSGGRDGSLLLRGRDLRDAERWLADAGDTEPRPTILQTQYVASSGRNAARRRRAGWTTLVAVLLGLTGLTVFALLQRSSAIARSKTAQSRSLAASALAQLSVDPERALLLASRAYDEDDTAQAAAALRRAVGQSRVRVTVRDPDVSSVMFSRDGRRLVTVGEDSTIRVWDARTGRPLRRLRRVFAVSADATLAVTGLRVARVTTLADGRTVRVLGPPVGRTLIDAAFAGDRVVTTDAHRGVRVARVWDLRRRAPVATLRGAFAFADPLGRRLFFDTPHGGLVTNADGERVAPYAPARYSSFDHLVSRDGTTVATRGLQLGAWRVATPRSVVELGAFAMSGGEPVAGRQAALSPDGSILAASVADGKAEGGGGRAVRGDTAVTLWNTAREKGPLARLTGHANVVRALAFSSGGRLLASGSDDTTARVWDVRSRRLLLVLRGHTGDVLDVAFDSTGRRLATASNDGTARIWDIEAPRVVFHRSAPVLAVDGRGRFAALAHASRAELWRLLPPQRVASVSLPDEPDSVMPASGGKRVAIGLPDGTARLWNIKTGALLEEPGPPRAFGRNGALLVTGSAVVRGANGTRMSTLRGKYTHPEAVAFAGADAAVGVFGRVNFEDSESRPRVWKVRTGELEHVLGRDGDKSAYVADTTSDGMLAATGSVDGTVSLFDLSSGEKLRTFPSQSGKAIFALAFDPSDKRLAIGGQDRVARVWDVDARRDPLVLAGHTNTVASAAFNRDGSLLVTGSDDGSVRVWDLATGEPIMSFAGGATAGFTRDGRHVWAAGQAVSVFACDACRRIADVRTLAGRRATRVLTARELARYG